MFSLQRERQSDNGFAAEVKSLAESLVSGELQPEEFLTSLDTAVETSQQFRQFGARPTAEAASLLDSLSPTKLALRKISRI